MINKKCILLEKEELEKYKKERNNKIAIQSMGVGMRHKTIKLSLKKKLDGQYSIYQTDRDAAIKAYFCYIV